MNGQAGRNGGTPPLASRVGQPWRKLHPHTTPTVPQQVPPGPAGSWLDSAPAPFRAAWSVWGGNSPLQAGRPDGHLTALPSPLLGGPGGWGPFSGSRSSFAGSSSEPGEPPVETESRFPPPHAQGPPAWALWEAGACGQAGCCRACVRACGSWPRMLPAPVLQRSPGRRPPCLYSPLFQLWGSMRQRVGVGQSGKS